MTSDIPEEHAVATATYLLNAIRMLQCDLISARSDPRGVKGKYEHRIDTIRNIGELIAEFGLTETLDKIIEKERADGGFECKTTTSTPAT